MAASAPLGVKFWLSRAGLRGFGAKPWTPDPHGSRLRGFGAKSRTPDPNAHPGGLGFDVSEQIREPQTPILETQAQNFEPQPSKPKFVQFVQTRRWLGSYLSYLLSKPLYPVTGHAKHRIRCLARCQVAKLAVLRLFA